MDFFLVCRIATRRLRLNFHSFSENFSQPYGRLVRMENVICLYCISWGCFMWVVWRRLLYSKTLDRIHINDGIYIQGLSIESIPTHKTKLRTRKTPIVASRITPTTSTTCYVRKLSANTFTFLMKIYRICIMMFL